ncbi:MAG: aminotransferase class I/II-fold pyridoxal phosphate-dependent enzyme [Bacteroidales bacterium]|nr:aminotransferase class I/II-fold pyridoxal phosphate-dependent enzyme [Bacteroidales bacterium]
MKINDFKLERYFANHEFTAKYLLSSSDCDGWEMNDVLQLASPRELKLWEELQLGYTESEGSSMLRESILQFYQQQSIEQVVVSSPGELNFSLMNVLLSRGDHVVCIAPAYQSLYEVVRSLGCSLSFWKPDPETWEFDTNDLEQLVRVNTKLIIINFPHNPTGGYLTLNQLSEIVSVARKHGAYLFSDEMYRKLMISDREELPPVCDLYEKGISLWGLSKSFGLAGLRTGWLVSQDKDLLKKVIAFKDYLSICSSGPSEVLSIIALNHADAFILPNMEKIRKNVSLFGEFTAEHDIISSFIPPKAGSTAFVKLNIENTSLEFSDRLVEQTGIMTVPAEMFDTEGKYIRIGFGRRNFPEVMEVFSQYLKTGVVRTKK